MQTRNDGMLNLSDKLREERKKNSEKLLEKTKEKAAEKKEKLEEKKAENEEEVTEEKSENEPAYSKVEQLLEKKIAVSKDGAIYLNDTDIRTIIEAVQEEDAGKTTVKEPAQVGANLDLKI